MEPRADVDPLLEPPAGAQERIDRAQLITRAIAAGLMRPRDRRLGARDRRGVLFRFRKDAADTCRVRSPSVDRLSVAVLDEQRSSPSRRACQLQAWNVGRRQHARPGVRSVARRPPIKFKLSVASHSTRDTGKSPPRM